MAENIFVTDEQEMDDLMVQYNLEDNGMSGCYLGYHWYSDDEADVNVYFKMAEED